MFWLWRFAKRKRNRGSKKFTRFRMKYLTSMFIQFRNTEPSPLTFITKKLGKWLQLGGHADGNPDVLAVALREAQEESGFKKIHALSDEIFDVDVHSIPKHGAEPAHFHYKKTRQVAPVGWSRRRKSRCFGCGASRSARGIGVQKNSRAFG